MRINFATPVSFGYSKKNQEYLEKKAATLEDREFADALVKTSRLCNEMEDKIKAKEKKGEARGQELLYTPLADCFISMKDTVINSAVEAFDGADEYLKSEHAYYSNSLKHCKQGEGFNWRDIILEKIEFWNTNLKDTSSEDDGENVKIVELSEDEVRTFLEKNDPEALEEYNAMQAQSAPAEDENAPVELMKKTKYSPSGFSDIMGMEKLKQDLKDEIIDPVRDPELARLDFVEYGKEIPKGILLFGPPGCGKTYIAEALAAELDTPCYTMGIEKSGSKYINQTANNIKAGFDYVIEKAKGKEKPVILFMDEMESLTFDRKNSTSEENLKQVSTMLKCIEDAQKHNVIVIGTSNKYDLIDPAIRRRFEMKQYVGLPDSNQRIQQLQNNLKKKAKAAALLQDENALKEVSEKLKGFSYHSINIIADSASIHALRRNRADISVQDFDFAIKETAEERINEQEYKPQEEKKMGFSI